MPGENDFSYQTAIPLKGNRFKADIHHDLNDIKKVKHFLAYSYKLMWAVEWK